jgi:tetratricopeptide (TPR) repeat protein
MSVKPAEHNTEGELIIKAQKYYENNDKIVNGVLGGILALIVGYIAFFYWYLPKQETEAQEQSYKAASYFENENYELALKGDGNFPGFLDIASKYRFTKSANLAHYYAGISYLNTGEYQAAIDQLKKFDSDDKVLSTIALGAIGDAYFELGNASDGINFYKKACNNEPNEFTTPIYLLRTALALQQQQKTDEAVEYLNRLKNDYPNSQEGKDAEKYLARMGK